jgi:hypothetical protein
LLDKATDTLKCRLAETTLSEFRKLLLQLKKMECKKRLLLIFIDMEEATWRSYCCADELQVIADCFYKTKNIQKRATEKETFRH